MQILINKWKGILLLAVLSFSLIYCSDDDKETDTTNIKLAENAALGSVITDKEGMTLYFFTKDVKGASVCEGGCLQAWPVFYQENIIPAAGLNASDFGTITRSDGSKQTTFKGWPLYYYAEDAKAGDVTGEDVGKVWYVAKPDYTLLLANNDIQYFSDINGKTLYYFTNDVTPDQSNCSGGCLQVWPSFFTEKLVIPSVLKASDFKLITRGDGSKQISYKGKPLYYYAQDALRGDNKGRAVNEKWYEIEP